MAKQVSISVTIMDYCKQTSTMSYDATQGWIDKLFGENDANNLKTLVETYSYGKATKTTQSIVNTFPMPDKTFFAKLKDAVNPKIGLDTVDQKAVLLFRVSATGKSLRLTLPAPMETMFYYAEDKGLRVKADVGDAICTALIPILGIPTLQFVRGYHTGKQ